MKRFISNIAGAGGFSVAAAILVVGLVTAVTSAQRDNSPQGRSGAITVTTDTTPGDGQDDTSPPETDNPSTPDKRLDDIESRLDDLDGLTADLADRADNQDKVIERVKAIVESIKSDVADVRDDVTSMQADIKSFGDRLTALSSAVDGLTSKTSKLNADGTYTGPVDPTQFSRRITPSDVNGQWPLDRTTGMLDINKLGSPTFGCNGDSRYNVFMSVDVFGKYSCVKVLK